jgi:hypothetical protein
MWNDRAFEKMTCDGVFRRIMLPKQVSAIQVLPADNAPARLGLITQLPSGAVVDVCGDGFNERTAKVRYCDGYFFVFLQDLQEPGYFGAGAR